MLLLPEDASMCLSLFSGEGIVFSLDEMTGAMQVSHKCVVSSKDFPGKSPY